MKAVLLVTLLGLGLVYGCGSSASTPPVTPPAISVTVSPSAAQAIDQGQTLSIAATVANDSSGKGVTWTVTGGGTLSATTGSPVTYTAPATVTSNTSVTVTATSVTDTTKSSSLTITVSPPPSISAQSLSQGVVSVAYSQTIAETGGAGALTFSVSSGTLPAGLKLTSNTGAIAGTPTATGTASFTVKVMDSSMGAAGSTVGAGPQSFTSPTLTITVNQAPAITSANSAAFTVSAAGTFTVTTTGTPTPSLAESGALPAGITFVDNGNGTGTLSGTAGTTGTFPITFTASNGVGSNATQTFTLTVGQPPAITSANSTTFTVGTAGTFTVTTTGAPTPSITGTGALPSGVTFTDNGNGTATLAGTPAAATGGTYQISIKAHNGIGTDATQTFTLTVDQAPAITSATSTTFTVGAAGTFTVTTTGFPEPSLTETGALPSTVTFTDNGNGTGTLSGTPGSADCGSYSITFKASNGVGSNATQNFTLTVTIAPLVISPTSGALPSGTVNGSYSETVSASGGVSPYTFSLDNTSSALPPGLSLSSAGVISGTPTTVGTYPNIVVDVKDSEATPVTKQATYSIIINSSAANCTGAPTGNESMLNGQYAVVVQGFVGSNGTPVAIAASVHADGAGTVTGGNFDVNNAAGDTHATISASSYTVGMDSTSSGNLGCVMLSLSNGSTTAFRFSLGGLNGSNVFSKGRIIEFDDATGTGSRVAGVLRLQDTTSFSLNQLRPRYAYGTDAGEGAVGHFASVGSFNVDTSGNISNDFEDNSILAYNTGGTGTINAISTTTGRATMTHIVGGQIINSVIYMVNADEAFIVGTGLPTYSGRAIATGSSFSSSSLSGNYIYHTTGINGNRSADVYLGLVNLNSGALSGTIYNYDINDGGSSSAIPSGATYAVDPTSGRTTISGVGSSAPVFYIAAPTANTEPISAFLLLTDSTAGFGLVESQPSQTYSTSALAGNYFAATEDPGDATVTLQTQVLNISSGGTVTGTGYDSGPSGLATQSVSGTISIASTGVGNTGTNTVAITNGTKIFSIEQGPAGGNPAVVTVIEHQ